MLAAPVRTVVSVTAPSWPPCPCPPAMLLDLGSTKRDIVDAMADLPPEWHRRCASYVRQGDKRVIRC